MIVVAGPRARAALALAAVLLVSERGADAEEAEARARTTLRSRAGGGKAIAKVPAGMRLPVFERSPDGRFLRVLVGDKEGWVAVDEVTMVDEPPPPEASIELLPEAQGKPERHGVRPEVWVAGSRYHEGESSAIVVTAPRADLLDRPRPDARKVGAVHAGARLASSRKNRDGTYFLVELPQGRVAWIAVADAAEAPPDAPAVARSSASPAAPTEPERGFPRSSGEIPVPPAASSVERPAVIAAAPPPPPPARVRLRLGAGALLARLDQRFTSNGAGRLSNYVDGTGLVGAEVDAGLDAAVGAGGFMLGVAASYRFGGAADITAHDGDRTVVLGVRSHDVEALAETGYRGAALGGWAVKVQAGARVILDLIDQDYVIAVPSERILALQIGAGVDLPRLAGGLGLAASAAYLPVGQRAQTEHLGEGERESTTGFSVAAALTYAITRGVCVVAAGRFARVSTRFDGPAERDPRITGASRETALGSFSLGLRVQRF